MIEPEAPDETEYAPYYGRYVRKIQPRTLLETLAIQGEETIRFLSTLSEEEGAHRYAEEKWTVKEVVGHMFDTERVMFYRAFCLARGEGQSLPGFDQDRYVNEAGFNERSMDALLEEYRATRTQSLRFFRSLRKADWVREGVANTFPVSVRALGYIIGGHEAHHLDHLKENYFPEGDTG